MAQISTPPAGIIDNVKNTTGQYVPALISLGVLYFMMGFVTTLNDTLVPFFRKGFTLNYAASSLVQFYFFLTYGIMSIPAGKIVERIGYKNGMISGFCVAAFGAFLFYPASVLHQYEIFLLALFVLAIGIVLLQVAANPYIIMLGPAHTASSRLTLIQGVGSIGTTVTPVFGAYFILSRLESSVSSSDAVRYPYIGIALLFLVIAFTVWQLNLPNLLAPHPVAYAHSTKGAKTTLSFRNLRLGIPAIFFYVGAEITIGTFLTNYIADILQVKEEAANSYVSFYWGGMLAGRLMGAGILKIIRPSIVLSGCALSAILLITISISSGGTLAIWSMLAVGLCNSIMFATIFSLSVNALGNYTTRASGYLSTAIVGGAVIPYLQGVVIDNYSWGWSFLVPLCCYLYIFYYGINGHKPAQ